MKYSSRQIFSVSELNRNIRILLEKAFPLIWVEGEISNLVRPASGHLYFSLKDKHASLRCALFKRNALLLDFTPANGMHVTVRGHLSLYEGRGDFQLITEEMEEAGQGALQRAFEQLKRRLQAEGLFDEQRKQALPPLPQRIGVLTSAHGAAIHDILTVLKRRFAGIAVRIYPVPVQGKEAAPALVKALQLAAQRNDCDVLLLTRGGGSLEDLQAFNDEQVARAIAACPLPVISAVGHESDFSITDFVADRRAATPSAAAELLSPDASAWVKRLQEFEKNLFRNMRRIYTERGNTLKNLQSRLRHPGEYIRQGLQRADELEQRLQNTLEHILRNKRKQFAGLHKRLLIQSPEQHLHNEKQHGRQLQKSLYEAMQQTLQKKQNRYENLIQALHLVSPLATLERGYAIVRKTDSGELVRRADEVAIKQNLNVRLAQGELICHVLEIPEPEQESKTPGSPEMTRGHSHNTKNQ